MWNSRLRQPEVMDQPGLLPQAHHVALRVLQRVNWLSRTPTVIWKEIARHARRDRPLRVLDLACGGGDVALQISRRALHEGISLSVTGADMSETAIGFAREQAARHPELKGRLEYVTLDVLRDPFPADFDIIYCTLFLHHLDEPEAVHVLRKMHEAARVSVLVDDLRRTGLGYAMAWVVSRTLTRSPVVRVDGPISVRGAFTIKEAVTLAQQAGWAGVEAHNHWPQRFLMRCSRDNPVPA